MKTVEQLEARKHILEGRTEKENGKIIAKLDRKIRKLKENQ